MADLIQTMCTLLNCEAKDLQDTLNHPLALYRVELFLKGKNLVTLYKNKHGVYGNVAFGGFGSQSSATQKAYEGYLGVTVQQHLYCRHRIQLKYPQLKCVVQYGNGGHNKYYPPELLKLAEDNDGYSSIFVTSGL